MINKTYIKKLKCILHVISIVVFFVLSVGMINDCDYLSSFCFFICFLLLIPKMAKFLYDKFKINKLIKYVLIIALFLIGMISSSSYKEMSLEDENNDKGTIVEKNEDIKHDVGTDKNDEQDNKKKILKTNSKEYKEYLNTAFNYATEGNEYWYYSDANEYYPYIQVSIKPRKEMTESEQIEQAKIVGERLLEKLDDYEYKSGNVFSYNYDTISLYFHYYMYGQMSRNGGPFMQFSIYDIEEIIVDEIIS